MRVELSITFIRVIEFSWILQLTMVDPLRRFKVFSKIKQTNKTKKEHDKFTNFFYLFSHFLKNLLWISLEQIQTEEMGWLFNNKEKLILTATISSKLVVLTWSYKANESNYLLITYSNLFFCLIFHPLIMLSVLFWQKTSRLQVNECQTGTIYKFTIVNF